VKSSTVMRQAALSMVAATLFSGAPLHVIAQSPARSPTQPQFCRTPEYRQFDFWVGDWDVFDVDRPNVQVARVQVDRILDGCVLREDYAGSDGHRGQSFSMFDASRKTWHQTWVTNRGELLAIEGSLQPSGEMTLNGMDHAPDGKERQVRGRWVPMNNGVREIAMRSTDGGLTWNLWFDLLFRRH